MSRLDKYPKCRQCGIRMTPFQSRKRCPKGPFHYHQPKEETVPMSATEALAMLADRKPGDNLPGNPDYEPDPSKPGLILDSSQLPDQPFYVWARDRYLSGHPGPEHSVTIFPCRTAAEAHTVRSVVTAREEMEAIVVVQGSSSRHRRLCSHIGEKDYEHTVFTPERSPYWFGLDDRTKHHRQAAAEMTFPTIESY